MNRRSVIALLFSLLSGCVPLSNSIAPTLELATSPSTCGPYQDVDVKFGAYDCARYTAVDGNFSCNLSQIPSHVSVFEGYEYVEDGKIDKWNGGWLYAQNFGFENYYVEYFSRSPLINEVNSLLENPDTQQQGLEGIFEHILLPSRESDASEVEVIRKEYSPNRLLLVELHSKSSELQVSQEASYIFITDDFFYFVTYATPIMTYESSKGVDKNRRTSAELQSYLQELYASCKFNR